MNIHTCPTILYSITALLVGRPIIALNSTIEPSEENPRAVHDPAELSTWKIIVRVHAGKTGDRKNLGKLYASVRTESVITDELQLSSIENSGCFHSPLFAGLSGEFRQSMVVALISIRRYQYLQVGDCGKWCHAYKAGGAIMNRKLTGQVLKLETQKIHSGMHLALRDTKKQSVFSSEGPQNRRGQC